MTDAITKDKGGMTWWQNEINHAIKYNEDEKICCGATQGHDGKAYKKKGLE